MPPTLSHSTIQARFRAAEALVRGGDIAGALAGYRDLLAGLLAHRRSRGEPLTAADAVVAERMADAAVLVGRLDVADGVLGALATLSAEVGNGVGAGCFLLQRAQVALAAGRLRGARAALRALPLAAPGVDGISFTPSGLERWEAGDPWAGAGPADAAVLHTRFYLASGGLLAALGSYARAEAALRRGLAHAGADATELAREAAAPLWLTLARAQLEAGEMVRAEASLAAAEAAYDAAEHPGLEARRLECRALLHHLRGELGAALESLRAVVELCRRGAFHAAAARAHVNLARTLIVLNQTADAAEVLAAAAGLATVADDTETRARAEWLLRLCDARSESLAPRAASAAELWRGVHEAGDGAAAGLAPELPESASHLALFEDLSLAVQWELAWMHRDWALRRLMDLRHAYAGCDSRIVRMRLLVLSAQVAFYRGAYARAEKWVERALPRLRELGLRPELWQALRFHAWCAGRLRRPQAEIDGRVAAAAAVLDELTDSLSPPDRVFYLLNKWTAEEERFASRVHQVEPVPARRRGALARADARSAAARVHGLMVDANRARATLLRARLGSHAAEAGGPDPSLWRTLAAHPARRATLTFVVLPDQVVILTATWLGLDCRVVPLTRSRLRERVRAWHRCARKTFDRVADGRQPPGPPERAALRRDGEAAIAALAAELELPELLGRLPRGVRALSLVLDDALHGFPFAAVRLGGRYLAQRYAITHAFSPFAAVRPAPRRRVRRALLVGVGGAHAPREDLRLPHVAAELDGVEHWVRANHLQSTRLDESAGRPACRAGVIRELAEAELLHVASHGEFAADAPARTGMLLFPAHGVEERLTLTDLAGLRLDRLQHVTLSACSSADSFVAPGRWIISLPEILCRTGAGSVLGWIWPVFDRVARHAQDAFYAALRGLPRDEALRSVQLAAIGGTLVPDEPETSDPMLWAGLALYGDPRRLRLGARAALLGRLDHARRRGAAKRTASPDGSAGPFHRHGAA